MKPIPIYNPQIVKEQLVRRPEAFAYLYVNFSVLEKHAELLNLARKHNILIHKADDKVIAKKSNNKHASDMVAFVHAPQYLSFKDLQTNLKELQKVRIAILSGIQDQHNFGAIVRTATAFGFTGLVIANHHQATITNTTFTTSVGTLGSLPLYRVANLSQVVEVLKKNHVWIAALDAKGETNFSDWQPDEKQAIIIGAEGEGVPDLLLQKSDEVVSIPMNYDVESLNASVAFAVLASKMVY